ncbi:unnamed protein product [Polarella glacialis]|uniref:Clp R domain-containing protein n=1 Tax=Polarella glacialis TaxID=89957 RepID=A0A813GNW2_POLGL|nr:unnamed protein product [Polarella glacialis]
MALENNFRIPVRRIATPVTLILSWLCACAISTRFGAAFVSGGQAGNGRSSFLSRAPAHGDALFDGPADPSTAPEAAACLGVGISLGLLLALRVTGTSSSAKLSASSLAGDARGRLQLSAASSGHGHKSVRAAVTRRAMFERFTAGSMKAVMMAQAESRKLGHDHVGTEMLVVGILAEGKDQGCKVLEAAGVKLPEALEKLQELAGYGSGGKAIEIPFTQSAKQVLEDAVEVARSEDSATVGSGHLLRALLKQDESRGTKLIGHILGCDSAEATRQKVFAAFGGEAKEGVGAPLTPVPGVQKSRNNYGPKVELNLTETLKYAEDLTAAAEQGKLDPLVGREPQLERTIRILGRRSKNNPVFVGEAGVGKTSIANGLAQRIVEGRVPPTLRDKRVLSLDLALLLAGTRYRGDFEERLRAVVKEVTESNRRVILVIDEVHTLVGAGSSGGEGGGMDAANLLKPALARGVLQCIGATTLDEYRKYIEKDPALERRFQPVLVPEPTQEEAEQILLGLAPRYEKHHQLRYTPEAIRSAVKLASQYISDRFLPDKAIDVMDEAGAKVRQQFFQEAELEEELAELRVLKEEQESVRQLKKAAVASENYQEAQQLKTQEIDIEARLAALEEKATGSDTLGQNNGELQDELKVLRARVQEAVAAERFDEASALKAQELEVMSNSELLEKKDIWVTEADVAQVVASWTGVAVEQVSATESVRLMRLEAMLSESVVGQQEAVSSVSRALRRARAGLRSPTRPIAALMFCGPTGVGKTELCKTLASCFFGSAASMIRLDMSEFMEKHTVSKLIGAPPGYIGFGEGGTLTEAVRRKPYSLVLFDEVEKAHPDVFNMLLQLLDDGRLTDSKGRTVSFANTMIVLTSNIGSRSVQKSAGGGMSLGFGVQENQAEANYSSIRELVHEEMKSFFRPEFLNRLDEICVFRPLTKPDIRAIAEVEFQKVTARLVESGIDISLTARFKEHVVTMGYDPAYGARPLRRAITRLLEDTLAEHLLESASSQDQDTSSWGRAEGTPLRSRVLVDISGDGRPEVHSLQGQKLPSTVKQLTHA